MNLSAIITCKDRYENLKFCLSSIWACRPRPRTIVVDFGSKEPLSFPEYKSWVTIIRVNRNTELFHKARAINIGIKSVQTKFLCITDADQVFNPNFFGVVHSVLNRNPKSFVMCRSYFLTEKQRFLPFDLSGVIYSNMLIDAKRSGINPHGDGCCNGVSTAWAHATHGYDESYVGYRAQDSDFALRAVAGGLVKVWIQYKTSMIHLPHKRIGEYYDSVHVIRNKQKYKYTAASSNKAIVVNKKGSWGEL